MDTTPNTHTDKPVYGVRPEEPGMYSGFSTDADAPIP